MLPFYFKLHGCAHVRMCVFVIIVDNDVDDDNNNIYLLLFFLICWLLNDYTVAKRMNQLAIEVCYF